MSNTGGELSESGNKRHEAVASANYSKLSDTDHFVEGIPVASHIPDFVKVSAPSDLPEGYQFTVLANNLRLIVAVPEGGVKEGQYFNAKVIGEDMDSSSGRVEGGSSIPIGNWRDGLCDCFDLGICHPQVWLSCCCFPIALGQVMTRLNLNWLGDSMEKHPSSCPAFKVLLISFIVWLCLDYTISLIMLGTFNGYDSYYYAETPPLSYTITSSIRQGIGFAYAILLLILLIRVRSLVRSKYSIREEYCTGCEDCCCSYWCHCCVVAQMARHLNDYERNPASCCSETGLHKSQPHIV